LDRNANVADTASENSAKASKCVSPANNAFI